MYTVYAELFKNKTNTILILLYRTYLTAFAQLKAHHCIVRPLIESGLTKSGLNSETCIH